MYRFCLVISSVITLLPTMLHIWQRNRSLQSILVTIFFVWTSFSRNTSTSVPSSSSKEHILHRLHGLFDRNEIQRFRAKFDHSGNVPALYQVFSNSDLLHSVSLSSTNTTLIDLYDMEKLTKYCILQRNATARQYFSACTGEFQNVLFWPSPLHTMSPFPLSGLTRFPTLIPHLTAVRDAFVNWNGQIFDITNLDIQKIPSFAKTNVSFNHSLGMEAFPYSPHNASNYRHGGCADSSWSSGWDIRVFYFHGTKIFHEPVLNLNHPYEGNVFHEIIEIYSQLVSYKPILAAFPNIQIIMSSRFQHTVTKYWPLLKWYGVIRHSLDELNIYYLNPEVDELVVAPYVITSLLGDCVMLLPVLIEEMKTLIDHNVPQFLLDQSKHSHSTSSKHRSLFLSASTGDANGGRINRDRLSKSQSTFSHQFTKKTPKSSNRSSPTRASPLSINSSKLDATNTDSDTDLSKSATFDIAAVAPMTSQTYPNKNRVKSYSHHRPKRYLVLYDRFFDHTRKMNDADDVFTLLESHVARPNNLTIVRFGGFHETLVETIQLFAQAMIVVGVHGAGLANMLFCERNFTLIVEVRPENYQLLTMEHLGRTLGFDYHVYLCGKGRYSGNIPIKPYQFVDYVKDVVQKWKIQKEELLNIANTT